MDLARAGESRAVPGKRDPDARRASRASRCGGAAPGSCRSRGARRASRAVSLPEPFEARGVHGDPLEDLFGGHALAQDLAGRRRVAEAVDIARPDLGRAQAQAFGDTSRAGSRRRTRSAARRSRGRRRSAACSFASPARGSGRSGSGTGRPRGARRGESTTGVSVQYAPPSMITSMSWATSRPSLVTPVRWRTIAGWRFVVARDVLVAVVDHPDRPLAFSARSAAWSASIEGYSSLPPNPPPVSSWMTRAWTEVDRERPLQRLVDVVRALQRAVDDHAAVLAGHGDHRVVLDVELLLVADAVLALEDEVGAGEPELQVARGDLVMGEDVVRRPPGRIPAGSGSVTSLTRPLQPAERLPVGCGEQGDAARRGAGSRPRPARGLAGRR